MVKICPKCGAKNYDDAFWCSDCNARLMQNKVNKELPPEEEPEKYDYEDELPYTDTVRGRDVHSSIIKIPLILIVVGSLIFASYYFVSNIGETNFNWDRYGGCPWDENNLPWINNDFPWVESLSIDDVFNSVTTSQNFQDVGEFNQDYWLQGNSITTSDGWAFTISKVKQFSYTARVLGYQIYNKDDLIYNPTEIFSQMDLFLGFEDIVDNPDSYPYKVVGYFYRGVWYQCDASSYYFSTHSSNTHIIPHTQSILNTLKSISLGDVVTMSGYYVNVYGSSGGNSYSWTTDTEIGNTHCEIILLDSISIN